MLEIEESLQKQRSIAAEATEEVSYCLFLCISFYPPYQLIFQVRAAIERSVNFVNKDNLEAKILEALEHPTVYDFAIDKQGNKVSFSFHLFTYTIFSVYGSSTSKISRRSSHSPKRPSL